jgi:hypothetical protein
MFGLLFDPEEGSDISSESHAFSELHGVITQKTILFMITAVRNFNAT